MDDIRLINLLASPSQNVKQPGITDSNSTNLPPIITRFPPGSILAGFIINRDANGNPVLRTESGDITFQSQLFLKIGAEVVIKVEGRSGNNVARIITVDGQPPLQGQPVIVTSPEQFATGPQTRPATATPQSTAAQPASLQAAPTTQTPAATVSNTPNLSGTVTASNTPELPQGTPLAVRLITVTQPQITGQTASQPAVAAAAPPTAHSPDAARYAMYKTTAAISTPPLATPQTTITPASIPAQTVLATVTGNTPAGGTVVQTPSGITITLQTTQPLPQGSTVNLQVSVANTPPNVAPAPLPPIASLTQKWPSLTGVLQLLTQELTADQVARSNFAWLAGVTAGSNQIPPSPQQISSGLIVFILALKGGDFRNWLGRENIQALENRGQQGLVKSAEADFMAITRQFNEAQPGQWQSLFFPVAMHGEVQQLRYYLKRERKKNTPGLKDEDTRFVIETELSQIGELQLDGFTRKQGKNLEFDLYIRTRSKLDETIQRDIFAIYNNFGELTGYKGQLTFQTVEEFPIHPLKEIIGEDDVGDVVV